MGIYSYFDIIAPGTKTKAGSFPGLDEVYLTGGEFTDSKFVLVSHQ
jgi:tetrahydromethanopterin S-methyltransferase subunit B